MAVDGTDRLPAAHLVTGRRDALLPGVGGVPDPGATGPADGAAGRVLDRWRVTGGGGGDGRRERLGGAVLPDADAAHRSPSRGGDGRGVPRRAGPADLAGGGGRASGVVHRRRRLAEQHHRRVAARGGRRCRPDCGVRDPAPVGGHLARRDCRPVLGRPVLQLVPVAPDRAVPDLVPHAARAGAGAARGGGSLAGRGGPVVQAGGAARPAASHRPAGPAATGRRPPWSRCCRRTGPSPHGRSAAAGSARTCWPRTPRPARSRRRCR